MATNTKEISKKVQEHILHSFDSYDDMMAELKNSQKHFAAMGQHNFGKEMADSGFFLAYHDDVRQYLQNPGTGHLRAKTGT